MCDTDNIGDICLRRAIHPTRSDFGWPRRARDRSIVIRCVGEVSGWARAPSRRQGAKITSGDGSGAAADVPVPLFAAEVVLRLVP